MPRRFPLQPLLDLAGNHTDAAARHLGQLKAQWNDSEEKLKQLLAYREDYRARLLNSTKLGMAANSLKDFQLFLGKLEAAIRQQAEEVERCKLRWEQARLEWQAQQRKLKAFDTLALRHQRSEQRREARLEQREQDELSGRVRGDPDAEESDLS